MKPMVSGRGTMWRSHSSLIYDRSWPQEATTHPCLNFFILIFETSYSQRLGWFENYPELDRYLSTGNGGHRDVHRVLISACPEEGHLHVSHHTQHGDDLMQLCLWEAEAWIICSPPSVTKFSSEDTDLNDEVIQVSPISYKIQFRVHRSKGWRNSRKLWFFFFMLKKKR